MRDVFGMLLELYSCFFFSRLRIGERHTSLCLESKNISESKSNLIYRKKKQNDNG